LSDETSALTDSFQDGLLSGTIYTRPADYGWKVPEVLTSGNFAKLINGGKMPMNTQKTRRPDLLKNKTALKLVFQHLETLYKINFKL
jgi:tRNA (guanine37-N1)-methyltransferase